MLLQEKLGNLQHFQTHGRALDWLPLEWYETGKRILHKHSRAGTSVTLKFLKEAPNLQQGDILYADEKAIIAVDILPCDVIIINPGTMYQMAAACYEIGNKHLPLFYQQDALLIPFEAPIFNMLQAAGFAVKKDVQKLLQPLKTSVMPHTHNSSKSLFSKILKRTSQPDANQPA